MPFWRRVRWNNVAKLATVLAACGAVVAWPEPRARPAPSPVAPVVVRPVVPPRVVRVKPPRRPRPHPRTRVVTRNVCPIGHPQAAPPPARAAATSRPPTPTQAQAREFGLGG